MRHRPWYQPSRTGVDLSRIAPHRGWGVAAGGASGVLQPPLEWRATSVQACAMWPFVAGAGNPLTGSPLGKNLLTRGTVCADPIAWFQRGGYITAPIGFILALNGFGKSSLLRHMMVTMAGFGVLPLVLGDYKPDFVDTIRRLEGQVNLVGPGRGSINPLDRSMSLRAADLLIGAENAERREEVLADGRQRRLLMVSALVSIQRGGPLTEVEDPLLAAALAHLDARHHGIPVLSDLLAVLQDAPPAVRAAAVDYGDDKVYREQVRGLQVSLRAMLQSEGRFGEVFSRPTTAQLDVDRPAVYDVSSTRDSPQLKAAALAVCWGVGFGLVNVTNVLAEAGLIPVKHRMLYLDELAATLGVEGMVDRIDPLTRINRTVGVGVMMSTHTIKDLRGAGNGAADAMKALGFIERAPMRFLGALPKSEMELLDGVTDLTDAEQRQLIAWQQPGTPTARAKANAPGGPPAPPGRGKFLLKVSGHPGIPFRVELTDEEKKVNDTNQLWHQVSRFGYDLDGAQAASDQVTADL